MNSDYKAYLDDFFLITILIKKEFYKESITYKLINDEELIDLKIKEIIDLGCDMKIVTVFDSKINPSKKSYVLLSNNLRIEVFNGKISRSKLFDSIYYYKEDDLGVTYKKNESTFKVWAPLSSDVSLELTDLNNETKLYKMEYYKNGVYSITINKNLERYKYRYKVYQNAIYHYTYDEYELSCDANSRYSYVIDKNKVYKNKYNNINKENNIIYEVNIRDFTSYFKNEISRSTYEFFYKENLKNKDGISTSFDYLKNLGVNTIEIMPINTYGAVDELDRFKHYNWGYNPVSYNTPSGMYVTDSNDPYLKLNEFKKMVDIIHKNNMKVVLDVVFNHIYDYNTYPMEVITRGYMFNYDSNEIRTEISGCKNDTNTKRLMVKKYIINSLKYYLEFYNVDGFRFDLMGLIDKDTMNEIVEVLKEIKKDVIIYGEGWKMIDSDCYSHMYNKELDDSIGFFNDFYRDNIKNYSIGLLNKENVKKSILGSPNLFNYPNKSVNYVECHDDYTLYDYIKMSLKSEDEEIKKRCILALSINILSFGVPFIHSASEFFYSKNGIRDSYNKGDIINSINWDNLTDNINYVNEIMFLIKYRKKHDVFSINDYEKINEIADISYTKNDSIIFKLDNLLIIFKNNKTEEEIDTNGYKLIKSNNFKDDKLIDIGYSIFER